MRGSPLWYSALGDFGCQGGMLLHYPTSLLRVGLWEWEQNLLFSEGNQDFLTSGGDVSHTLHVENRCVTVSCCSQKAHFGDLIIPNCTYLDW